MSTVGMFSAVGDIMIHVGGIMIHVGNIIMHVGGYHEYRTGVQYHGGTQIRKDYTLHGTETSPMVRMISRHMYHDIPHGTHDIPHGTEHTLYRVKILKKFPAV